VCFGVLVHAQLWVMVGLEAAVAGCCVASLAMVTLGVLTLCTPQLLPVWAVEDWGIVVWVVGSVVSFNVAGVLCLVLEGLAPCMAGSVAEWARALPRDGERVVCVRRTVCGTRFR
jgi:hypothetical protein